MKTFSIFIMVATLSLASMAQSKQDNKIKLNELGITFSDLNRFGLVYKTGRDHSLWRFQTLMVSHNNQKSTFNDYHTDAKHKNADYTVKIGRINISEITENFDFRFGVDLFYTYSKDKEELNIVNDGPAEQLNEQIANTYGMNFVLGFHHLLNEHILIGAEFLPHFSYRSGSVKKYADNEHNNPETLDIKGYSYGISNNSVQVNLTYRF
ncbi:MAG: hypothetical protein ACQESX_11645 [Bacteroidota bacterium]